MAGRDFSSRAPFSTAAGRMGPASRPGGGAGPSLAITAAEAGRRVYYGTLAGLIDSLTESNTPAPSLGGRPHAPGGNFWIT